MIENFGLTSAQINEQIKLGNVNIIDNRSSRKVIDIVRQNVFTLFNLILIGLMVLMLFTKGLTDALFGIVIIINSLIGIAVELKSKTELDNLSILSQNKITVLRDGVEVRIAPSEVVLGDSIVLSPGDQVVVDGVLEQVNGLRADESHLTGESDTISKSVGEQLLSGSFITEGTGILKTEKVGAEVYANKLTNAAKVYKKSDSELQSGINSILKFVSIVIVPFSILIVWAQSNAFGGFVEIMATDQWRDVLASATAAIVSMIPEGLVLLTTLNFALAVIVLSRKNVLVSEMNSVETLARVTTLCLDKTGTLTTGKIVADSIDYLGEDSIAARDQINEVLYTLTNEPGSNDTAVAIAEYLLRTKNNPTGHCDNYTITPFNSKDKYSKISIGTGTGKSSSVIPAQAGIQPYAGATQPEIAASPSGPRNDDNRATEYVLGAPDFILDKSSNVLERASNYADQSYRVLAFKNSETGKPLCLVKLTEQIRDDAKATLEYFHKQGVRPILISGDNLKTVAAISEKVNLPLGKVKAFDATGLLTEQSQLQEVLREFNTFARVTPEQKLAIVKALQADGETVAMTGDGINDALALKEADLGVAMPNASSVTKSVSEIVLMDGKFSSLPFVVGQGRRIMANMERVSSLFLTKTSYAFVLAILTTIFHENFPYSPRYMTIISALVIGVPSFFLALEPNNTPYKKGFLKRVLHFSIPAGLLIGVVEFIAFRWVSIAFELNHHDSQLFGGALLFVLAFIVLVIKCRPYKPWKIIMLFILFTTPLYLFLLPVTHLFFFVR
jgi:cation-transporting ATPase E